MIELERTQIHFLNDVFVAVAVIGDVIVNSWAWLVSLSICTLVIFSLLDYRGEEALPESA